MPLFRARMSDSSAPTPSRRRIAARLRAARVQLAGWALLALALLGLFWLAMGPLYLGPSDWDDTMYAERAVSKGFAWDARNRYVHVWAIRLVDQLVPSHRTAAGAWGALCVCGLAALAFVSARRIGGWVAGALAFALVPLFPPMLKYLSVPHVDFTMALFSMLALLSAVLAVESPRRGVARAAAFASGVFVYWALKSKETGLVVLPLTAYVMLSAHALKGQRRQNYALWALGLALGFLALFAFERALIKDAPHHPSDPTIYFAPPPPAANDAPPKREPPPRVVRDDELLDALRRPAFFAITALGLAGFASAGRRSLWARALGLWALALLAFTALVSFYSRGVDAEDRYLIAVGAALAPLAAANVVALFRRPAGEPAPGALAMLGLLLLTVPLVAWSLWAMHQRDFTEQQLRAVMLVGPLALMLLFLATFVAPRRWLAGPAALLLLMASALVSIDQARDHLEQKRHELAPWTELAHMVDAAAKPRIAVLHGKSYRASRLRWRLRLFSRQALLEIAVRDIDAPDRAEPGEWVFVGATHERALESANYRRVLALEGDPRPWALYTKP
jgi:hypothetical protein